MQKKYFVFNCKVDLGSRSDHYKQVFHLHGSLMDHSRGVWVYRSKYGSKTKKFLEENKGVGKDYLGPKIINLKGKVDEFYYLKILFHQMTLLRE